MRVIFIFTCFICHSWLCSDMYASVMFTRKLCVIFDFTNACKTKRICGFENTEHTQCEFHSKLNYAKLAASKAQHTHSTVRHFKTIFICYLETVMEIQIFYGVFLFFNVRLNKFLLGFNSLLNLSNWNKLSLCSTNTWRTSPFKRRIL